MNIAYILHNGLFIYFYFIKTGRKHLKTAYSRMRILILGGGKKKNPEQ
jgi:hypothetical protein